MSSQSGTWKSSRVRNFRGLWFQNFGGSLAGSCLPEISVLETGSLPEAGQSVFSQLTSVRIGGGGWWDGGVHPPVPGAWMLAPSRALPTPSLVECSQAPGPSSVCSSITACPTLFLLLARHPSLNDSSPGLPSLPVPMPRAHPACPGGLLTADRLGPESLMCHCQAREQPCRASVFPSTKWG